MPEQEIERACTVFTETGKSNTEKTLQKAARRARELDISTIILPSTSGETGLLAAEIMKDFELIVVTHSTGFIRPDFQQMSTDKRRKLEDKGAKVLTCQHALGGVGRAVRKKLDTYQTEEIIAQTLRLFGEGTKVAIEITLMAADAGLVVTQTPCISIGGTGEGVDTALVIHPAHAQDFFDLKVMEIIAKPRLK
jgi:uncharacterized protein